MVVFVNYGEIFLAGGRFYSSGWGWLNNRTRLFNYKIPESRNSNDESPNNKFKPSSSFIQMAGDSFPYLYRGSHTQSIGTLTKEIFKVFRCKIFLHNQSRFTDGLSGGSSN